jgi:4-carboxymuconolactone decarboxylase
MPRQHQQLRERVRSIAPALVAYTDRLLLGEVWEDATLSKRDRSLATIAALMALHRPEALADHLLLGRTNGVTDAEIEALTTHIAFYAGWPAAMVAARVTLETLHEKGI